MKRTFLLLILALIVAGCTVQCYEKEDNSCCKGEYCVHKDITCTEGTRPVFLGCSKECEPQWECQSIQTS